MAGNIAGMFAQINKAVQGNPLAAGNSQGDGGGLLGIASQGLGNAAAAGMNAINGPEGYQSQGVDFMNDWAKEREEEEMAKKVTAEAFKSDNPDTMEKAAQQLEAMGKVEQADRLMKRATALRAKNNAVLEAGNQGIQEKSQRIQQQGAKTNAIAMARRRGDMEALKALQAGTIAGEDYMKKVANEKRRSKLVGKGAVLVDEDEGTVIYENVDPADLPGASYKMTGPDKTALYKSQEAWQKNNERSTQAQATADAIKAVPADDMKAGAYATASDWINGVMGTRDKAAQLRTQYLNIQKSGIVQAMPSGPQSDNDVRIFSKGFPPENAGKAEIVEFLEAQARIANRAAEYEEMKIDHITSGRQGDFIKSWKRHTDMIARQERMVETPAGAIQYLRENPETIDAFRAEYGWAPEPQELAQ